MEHKKCLCMGAFVRLYIFLGERPIRWSKESVTQQRLRITGAETDQLVLQLWLCESISFQRDNLLTILRWDNLKVTHFIWKRKRIRKIKYMLFIPKMLFILCLLLFLSYIIIMALYYLFLNLGSTWVHYHATNAWFFFIFNKFRRQ